MQNKKDKKTFFFYPKYKTFKIFKVTVHALLYAVRICKNIISVLTAQSR